MKDTCRRTWIPLPVLSGVASILLLAAPAVFAQDVFSLHGRDDCGGPAAGVSRTLSPGTHHVTLSDAYSFWSSDGENGGNTWITRVVLRDTNLGTDTVFAAGTGFQPTAAAAESEVAGIVFEFGLAVTTPIWFYLSDGGGCGDNRGHVTVTLDDPATETRTTSWGTLKQLYR